MDCVIREAEHLDSERGFAFRVKSWQYTGTIVDVRIQSLHKGLFETLSERCALLIKGKTVKEAYLTDCEAYQKAHGPFGSDMEREACGIIFSTFRRTLDGIA